MTFPTFQKCEGNYGKFSVVILESTNIYLHHAKNFEDITGITYKDAMEMQRKRENELMNKRALLGGIKDAGQYAYLGGQAQMEAAKNIGLNTQDMLRSMAYGQAALANTIAGASKTVPLARTYFS